MLLKLSKGMSKVNQIWDIWAEIAIVLMAVLIFIDVLLRLILDSPIVGAYEICQLALCTSIFASFALLQSDKGHVTVTMLINKFPRAVRSVILLIMYGFATVFIFLLGRGALQMGMEKFANGANTATLLIPYWPFYFFEAISMFLFALTLLLDTVILCGSLFNKELRAEVDSWEGDSAESEPAEGGPAEGNSAQ